MTTKHPPMSKLPEYRAWSCMKTRCLNPNAARYPYYGGRGIGIAEHWIISFLYFLADIIAEIGPHPGPGWSLDRKNNDGNYEPGNVRWATQSQQRTNSRRRPPHTAETRAKMSAAHKGRKQPPRTPEHCAKLSAALKGRPYTLRDDHGRFTPTASR